MTRSIEASASKSDPWLWRFASREAESRLVPLVGRPGRLMVLGFAALRCAALRCAGLENFVLQAELVPLCAELGIGIVA